MICFSRAGVSIEQLCEIAFTDPLGYPPAEKDRLSMVRAARVLLQNVTRVLLLADIVVVKQLMVSKEKVDTYVETLPPSPKTKTYTNPICC